jgi:enamine deaminase RidA (YjgF/YER057c/UK114 family)
VAVERLDVSNQLGPSPGYAYVATARDGLTVYTAGAVPIDPRGNLIGENDLEAQTRAVTANLQIALDRAGATAADVVRTTIYVVAAEQGDLPKVWEVFAEIPLASAPSTLVGVTHLGYTGQLVEIEAIAVVP